MKAVRKSHAKAESKKAVPSEKRKLPQVANVRVREVMTIAEQAGLFDGPRNKIVRGRMPQALVEQAKARSGARTDTELIEMALANLAVADKYMEWLVAQSGSVTQDIDLEF